MNITHNRGKAVIRKLWLLLLLLFLRVWEVVMNDLTALKYVVIEGDGSFVLNWEIIWNLWEVQWVNCSLVLPSKTSKNLTYFQVSPTIPSYVFIEKAAKENVNLKELNSCSCYTRAHDRSDDLIEQMKCLHPWLLLWVFTMWVNHRQNHLESTIRNNRESSISRSCWNVYFFMFHKTHTRGRWHKSVLYQNSFWAIDDDLSETANGKKSKVKDTVEMFIVLKYL